MRTMIKRLRQDQGGFTVTEMLVTTAIMVIAASIVSVGMPAALSAYANVVNVSNGQVLLSNTAAMLRDELDMSREVSVSSNTITFIDTETGHKMLLRSNDAKGIMIQDKTKTGAVEELFIPEEMATNDLRVTYEGVAVSDAVLTFTNLRVYTEDENNPATLAEFDVRLYGIS